MIGGRLGRIRDEILSGEPGARFRSYHDKSRARETPARRALFIGIGIVLVFAGATLGFLPLLPGVLLGVPGLALLAARMRMVAGALDRTELVVRRMIRKVRGKDDPT